MKHTCGNCEYHERERESGEWICMNRDSDLYGLETGCGDSCLDYELKEED